MADNKKYYWLKLKEDFFRQKEIKKLRKIAGGDTYTVIYLKMLLLSLMNDCKIYFEGIEDNFIEELALELEEEEENVKVTVMFLLKYGLLEETSESEFSLSYAKECLGQETEGASRVRKFRNNQKALHCNSDVTNCNTEIEIEKDIEIEKKKNSRFIKPTLDQIQAYITEINSNVNAQHFYDYYQSNGWKVGKNAMKDYKATIRNWNRKETPKKVKEEVPSDWDKPAEVIDVEDTGEFEKMMRLANETTK